MYPQSVTVTLDPGVTSRVSTPPRLPSRVKKSKPGTGRQDLTNLPPHIFSPLIHESHQKPISPITQMCNAFLRFCDCWFTLLPMLGFRVVPTFRYDYEQRCDSYATDRSGFMERMTTRTSGSRYILTRATR